ncbi:hypothetical protein QR680_014523 [Steinernema hermaphroditum]|uniref:Uncharacterized protein n=1 Tax=Steinernema hermaphroditum TaxID=289476 RepID=A0AA39IBT5_9BILA|nr:hypothetical protein QR680_014523 [Steinernema hermaphroditum]
MKAILVLFALLVAVECYYVARPISYDDQPHYATVPLAYQRPPRCPMNNPDCIRKFKAGVLNHVGKRSALSENITNVCAMKVVSICLLLVASASCHYRRRPLIFDDCPFFNEDHCQNYYPLHKAATDDMAINGQYNSDTAFKSGNSRQPVQQYQLLCPDDDSQCNRGFKSCFGSWAGIRLHPSNHFTNDSSRSCVRNVNPLAPPNVANDQVKHWKYSKAMDRRCHPQSEISVNYDELRSKVAETTTRLDDTLSELARGPRFSVKIAYTRQVFLAQHAFREHQLALEELLQALFPEAHEVREDQALIIKPNVTVAEQDSHVKMLLTAARMDERAVQRIFRDPKQNFLVIRFVRKELMNEFLHQFRELNLFKLLGGCARLTRDMNADERKKYRKAIQECEVKNKTLPNRSFYVDLVTLQVCEKHEMNPLPRKFER